MSVCLEYDMDLRIWNFFRLWIHFESFQMRRRFVNCREHLLLQSEQFENVNFAQSLCNLCLFFWRRLSVDILTTVGLILVGRSTTSCRRTFIIQKAGMCSRFVAATHLICQPWRGNESAHQIRRRHIFPARFA